MRICSGVALLAICLLLTGCSLFGKKPATPTAQTNPDLAPPTFPTRDRTTPDPVSTASQVNGVLAGQILDMNNRRQGGVAIQVVDLEDTREPKAATIERQADDQGYFRIEGLRPRGHYQLTARTSDGERTYVGVLVATPPNPRLTIWVREDANGSGAPRAPAQVTYPGRPDASRGPAASLEAPERNGVTPATAPNPSDRSAIEPAPPTGSAPAPDRPAQPDPTRTTIRDGLERKPDGFERRPDGFERKSEPVNIPPANPNPPPAPGGPHFDDPARDFTPRAGFVPMTQPPAQETAVPSCQLVGRKLINMALYDCNGRVWEYRKDRTGHERIGRLTLIDFWSSRCGPCLAAMPRLVELTKYEPYGLDLVGIAYETGTAEQRVSQVRSVRGRYGIRYPTLMGDLSDCPVRAQFDVQAFPTLILLDENGMIVYRNREGMSGRDFQELEFEIRRRLNLR